MDTLSEIQEIMRDVFENDDVNITRETVADDIEEWDSLTHIQLVVAIEKHFGLKFKSIEVQRWSTVGEVVDSIESKK